MQSSDDIKKSDARRGRSKQAAIGVNPRVTFGFLLFLSIVTLGMGVVQIQRTIRSPFEGVLTAENNEQIGQIQPAQDQDALLRQKDTDQDGLSDFDELNIYGTSPYLPDSDSDGFSDAEELANGHDPNCPIGQDCFVQTDERAKSQSESSFEDLLDDFNGNPASETIDTILEAGDLDTIVTQ